MQADEWSNRAAEKKSETLTDRPVERGASGVAITNKIISGVTVFSMFYHNHHKDSLISVFRLCHLHQLLCY